MRIKTIIGILFLIVFPALSVDLAFSQDDQILEKMATDEELEQEFKWLKAETYVRRLDYFFNNAGIGIIGNVNHYGIEDWNYITWLCRKPKFQPASQNKGE